MLAAPTLAIVTEDHELHQRLAEAATAAGFAIEAEPCAAAVVLVDGRRAGLLEEVQVLSRPLGAEVAPRCVVVTSRPLDGAAIVELVGAGLAATIGPEATPAELRATVERVLPGASAADEVEQTSDGAREALQRLLVQRGYSIVLQPIVDLNGGHLLAVEALARFGGERPRPPMEWLALAERAGMRSELEIALASAAIDLLPEIPAPTLLSINVSGPTLMEERLAALLQTCDASRVMLELTDHHLIEDYEGIAEAVAVLRAMGPSLAVDDSGVGLHSLARLAPLGPAFLSLDGSLVRGIEGDTGRRALTGAVVSFATAIGAKVIAEHVETATEAIALRDLGVRFGQGYLIAPPSDVDGIPEGPVAVPIEEPHTGPTVIRTFTLPRRADDDFHAASQAVLTFLETEQPGRSTLIGQFDFALGRFGVVATRGPVTGLLPPGTTVPIGESLEYWMVKGRGPQLCPDIAADPVFGALKVAEHAQGAAFMSAALVLDDGTTFGTISAYSSRRNDFTQRDLAILQGLAELLSSAVSKETLGWDRATVMRHLRNLARTDSVTKLLNAPGFSEELDATLHRSRSGAKRYLLRFQIDDVGSIASRYGRAVCDLMLKDVAGCLAAAAQPMDVVGRVGDGELAALLLGRGGRPDVDAYLDGAAARLAEKVRKREVRPNVRVGVADLAEAASVDALFAAAEPGDVHLAQSNRPAD